MILQNDLKFTIFTYWCSECQKNYQTKTAYMFDDVPTTCEANGEHSIQIISKEEYCGVIKAPQKGDIFLAQFLCQHINRNLQTEFAPIILRPPNGKMLEIVKVSTVWHERLISRSATVWEVRMFNPFFDSGLPVSPTNPEYISISQFYYRDFAELWGGAYFRPPSDGPTREMQHIFTDRNNYENKQPFVLKSSLGMHVYAYSTNEPKRVDGEGITFNTINGMKIYIPYQENVITNGKYDASVAACYPEGFVVECECDDCFSLNAMGSLFDEV